MANTTTIEPEYVYMTIPADYVCTYNKILQKLFLHKISS